MKWRKTHIVFIDIRWLFVKIILTILLVYGVITYLKWTQVTNIQFKSEDLAASWQITNIKTVKSITSGLKESAVVIGPRPKRGTITMQLKSQRETKTFIFVSPEVVYDCQEGQLLAVPEDLARTLKAVIVTLKKKSPYGEIVDWEKVKLLLPVGRRAVVTDLDTKSKFTVLRTGGFSHVDFEPQTNEDVKTVQTIYGDKWNWKRRAVIVDLGEGMKIAASLVGMPQGLDVVKGNGCPGSLGLFFNSKEIARSNNLSHQVMIWKAAGKTYDLLKQLSPEETIMVLFTSLDQYDWATFKKVVKPIKAEDKLKVQDIIGVTIIKQAKQAGQCFDITLSLSLKKGPYNHLRSIKLNLLKDQDMGYYYTNRDFLDILLK